MRTRDRARAHTAARVNARLDRRTEDAVARYANAGAGAISRRLDELEREWDIERALETNAAAFALAGLALGVTRDRRWLAVPGVILGFLLEHAVQGWCPPVPLFRRLGVRTRQEIDRERSALKALRGDFEGVRAGVGAAAALRAARA